MILFNRNEQEWRFTNPTFVFDLFLTIPMVQIFALIIWVDNANRQGASMQLIQMTILAFLVMIPVSFFVFWRFAKFNKEYTVEFYYKSYVKQDSIDLEQIQNILEQMDVKFNVKNKFDKYPIITNLRLPRLIEIQDYNIVIILEEYRDKESKVKISMGKRTDGNEAFLLELQARIDQAFEGQFHLPPPPIR